MSATTKLTIAIAAIAGLSFTGMGIVSHDEARATPAFNVQQANPTITISQGGGSPPYVYSPAQVQAKAGQAITVKSTDSNGVHTVTAKDKSFSVDVPPNSTVTLTVKKPGTYPYYCTYHPGDHNEASLTIS